MPFYHPKKKPIFLKNTKIWKIKKFAGDIIILHMHTKNHNIWCMVPSIWSERHNLLLFWAIFIWCMVSEIWSKTDIIFCHLGPFFALLPPPPLTTRKIKILKKWEKTPGYIIILHMCTINDNHMMYGSWDMEHDRHNFLSFSTVFCPFTPLTTKKINILKKWKRSLEISFYTCVP